MKSEPVILFVDDDADTVRVVSKLLGIHGYNIRTATGYRSALEAAKQQQIDLLVCDIGLADGDGCDLLRELRELYGLHGIAVTGYGMAEDVQRCMKAGFAAHVLKPFEFQRLTSAIDETLGTRQPPSGQPGVAQNNPTPV